jgi:hypothetical protein
LRGARGGGDPAEWRPAGQRSAGVVELRVGQVVDPPGRPVDVAALQVRPQVEAADLHDPRLGAAGSDDRAGHDHRAVALDADLGGPLLDPRHLRVEHAHGQVEAAHVVEDFRQLADADVCQLLVEGGAIGRPCLEGGRSHQ